MSAADVGPPFQSLCPSDTGEDQRSLWRTEYSMDNWTWVRSFKQSSHDLPADTSPCSISVWFYDARVRAPAYARVLVPEVSSNKVLRPTLQEQFESPKYEFEVRFKVRLMYPGSSPARSRPLKDILQLCVQAAPHRKPFPAFSPRPPSSRFISMLTFHLSST